MGPDVHHLGHLLLVVVVVMSTSEALVRQAYLPDAVQACYNDYPGVSLRSVVGHQFCHFCEDKRIHVERSPDYPIRENESSIRYLRNLIAKVDRVTAPRTGRVKRQAHRRRCRRREYRMLSDVERRQFHDAINILKRDRSAYPNKYDAIAALHSGSVVNATHYGANFLGFHRIFILIFEVALQEVNPSICIPYWDSTLDNELEYPAESQIFGPTFMGGRGTTGVLTDGPFRGWITPWAGPLMRNIGVQGQLFTTEIIRNILSQRYNIDIVPPFAALPNSLEYNHDGVHQFVGGQMIPTVSAAHDPIFLILHCYTDYLWETFRTLQRAFGINPDTDYPRRVTSALHAPNAPLGFYGLKWTTSFGYSSIFSASYEYEPSPTCTSHRRTCRSRNLRCDVTRGRCIPIDRHRRYKRAAPTEPAAVTANESVDAPVPGESNAEPLDVPMPSQTYKPSPCRDGIKPIQNNYCVDGRCDINKWAYVPAKVVTLRPPDYKDYHSYPIVNGHLSRHHDIYEPAQYTQHGIYNHPIGHTPKGYSKCNIGKGIGQVFVESQGINYEGYYKESALIDQRLATSMAVTYVAVKRPIRGPTLALFRAFDACGRICQPACLVPGTNHYKVCSGALEIVDVPGQPRQYSYDYNQASANIWHIDQNNDCPSLKNNDIPITFYCNYKADLPTAWTNPGVHPRYATYNDTYSPYDPTYSPYDPSYHGAASSHHGHAQSYTGHASTHYEPAPIHHGPAPVHPGHSKSYTGHAATHYEPAPKHPGHAQSYTGQASTHYEPDPIHLGPAPIHPGPAASYTGQATAHY